MSSKTKITMIRAIASAIVLMTGHGVANATLINATVLASTPTLYEAFIDIVPGTPSGLFDLSTTEWQVFIDDNGKTAPFKNVQHLIAPHVGEPAPAAGLITAVPCGSLCYLGGVGFSALGQTLSHEVGGHKDIMNFRWDPINSSLMRASVRLIHGASSSDNIPLLGPLALAAVPEPTTLAIFGFGLAGLGFMRRRRKSH